MILKRVFLIVSFISLLAIASPSSAQCPMCRTAVESARDLEGSTQADGLNKGILYLLSLPYLTVAVVGGIWYSKRKKSKNQNAD
jgi:hypothetical protein